MSRTIVGPGIRDPAAIVAALHWARGPGRSGLPTRRPAPRLLAITGASHVTGWLPPLPDIIAAAHHRGIPVLVDAAQLAPHRPLPGEADFLAWSGHKMYAPFGTGVLVGPRRVLAVGDRFLAGGGAASCAT